MYNLLLFPCNNGYANAPQCTVNYTPAKSEDITGKMETRDPNSRPSDCVMSFIGFRNLEETCRKRLFRVCNARFKSGVSITMSLSALYTFS